MLRIIGGDLKGRKLQDSSSYHDIRPTTDRNREAIFNILDSGKFADFFTLQESTVLDLCSGTGAFAIEAISRGAKKAICVEKNIKHVNLIKSNVEKLQISEKIAIFCDDFRRFNRVLEPLNLIFIDPPYKISIEDIDQDMLKNGLINDKTLLIVEYPSAQNFKNLQLLDSRKYGGSIFSFYKLNIME